MFYLLVGVQTFYENKCQENCCLPIAMHWLNIQDDWYIMYYIVCFSSPTTNLLLKPGIYWRCLLIRMMMAIKWCGWRCLLFFWSMLVVLATMVMLNLTRLFLVFKVPWWWWIWWWWLFARDWVLLSTETSSGVTKLLFQTIFQGLFTLFECSEDGWPADSFNCFSDFWI